MAFIHDTIRTKWGIATLRAKKNGWAMYDYEIFTQNEIHLLILPPEASIDLKRPFLDCVDVHNVSRHDCITYNALLQSIESMTNIDDIDTEFKRFLSDHPRPIKPFGSIGNDDFYNRPRI